MKEIKYLSLKDLNAPYEKDIQHAISEVVSSGWYLQGKRIHDFEEHYAEYIGTRHCISCGNGLDALKLMLQGEMILGRMQPGDEVLVAANTYIATILAITSVGLTPILIEPSIDTLQMDDSLIESHITGKTRALLTVHLYGKCSVTPNMMDICKKHHLLLFEDNAQAHGCIYRENGKRTGSLGTAAAHSFYPGKNLGALGDAGAVTTDDDELADVIRALGNYGSARKYVFDYQGRNSRMDEIQAAVLDVKLKHLDETNERRQDLAELYVKYLGEENVKYLGKDNVKHPGEDNVKHPGEDNVKHLEEDKMNGKQDHELIPSGLYSPKESNVVHIFPILSSRRDELQQYLKENGVGTMIHYPIPPHQQKCYAEWNHLHLPITEKIHQQELSLPCNQSMTEEDVERIAELIRKF